MFVERLIGPELRTSRTLTQHQVSGDLNSEDGSKSSACAGCRDATRAPRLSASDVAAVEEVLGDEDRALGGAHLRVVGHQDVLDTVVESMVGADAAH